MKTRWIRLVAVSLILALGGVAVPGCGSGDKEPEKPAVTDPQDAPDDPSASEDDPGTGGPGADNPNMPDPRDDPAATTDDDPEETTDDPPVTPDDPPVTTDDPAAPLEESATTDVADPIIEIPAPDTPEPTVTLDLPLPPTGEADAAAEEATEESGTTTEAAILEPSPPASEGPATTPAAEEATAAEPPAPAAVGLIQPKLAVRLDEKYNTPDGMTLKSDGNIILAVPVVLQEAGDADLLAITPEDKVEPYFTLPAHPETGKACPLGIEFGSDGNLYIADSQGIGGDNQYKSGVIRLVHEDGKPVRAERVVDGMVFSNGLACFADKVYVCETSLDPDDTEAPMESGVYCFDLSELDADNPVKVAPGGEDPHLIFRFTTHNPDWMVGANGLGFGFDGTMYVCNFGDAELIAVTLEADGRTVKESKVVAKGGPMKSTDGLKVDPESNLVYIADFVGNSVHEVNPATGEVRMLAASPQPNTGEGGALDKCSEVCLRDGKVYVANIDLAFDENTNDDIHTISVIELP